MSNEFCCFTGSAVCEVSKTSAASKTSDGSSFIYVITASEGAVSSLKIDASGNPQFVDADCKRSHSQVCDRPFDVYDVNGMIIENIEIEEFEFCVAENGDVTALSSGRSSSSVTRGSDSCQIADGEKLRIKPALKNGAVGSVADSTPTAVPRAVEPCRSSCSTTPCAQLETKRRRDSSNSFNAVVVCERLDAAEIQRLSFGSNSAKDAISPRPDDSDCDVAVAEQHGCRRVEPLHLEDEDGEDAGKGATVADADVELRISGERTAKAKVLRTGGDVIDDAKTLSPGVTRDSAAASASPRRGVGSPRFRNDSSKRRIDLDSSQFSNATEDDRRQRSEHGFNASDDNPNDSVADNEGDCRRREARVGSELSACGTSDATADNNVDVVSKSDDEKEAASLCERIDELEKRKLDLLTQLELIEQRRSFSTASAAREPLKDVGLATRAECRLVKLRALDNELKELTETLTEEEEAVEQRRKHLKDREEKLELLRVKLNDEEDELRNSETLRQRTELVISSEITRLNVLTDAIKHEKNFREDEHRRLLSRLTDDTSKLPVGIMTTSDDMNVQSICAGMEKSSATTVHSCSNNRQTRSVKELKLTVSTGNGRVGKSGVKRQLSSGKDVLCERLNNNTKKTRLSQKTQESGKERTNVFSQVTSWFKKSVSNCRSNS